MTDHPDPRDRLIRKLLSALIRANGGERARRMASSFYAGRDVRSIAAEHGVSRSTCHRSIVRITTALDDAGVLPGGWCRENRVPPTRDKARTSHPHAG